MVQCGNSCLAAKANLFKNGITDSVKTRLKNLRVLTITHCTSPQRLGRTHLYIRREMVRNVGEATGVGTKDSAVNMDPAYEEERICLESLTNPDLNIETNSKKSNEEEDHSADWGNGAEDWQEKLWERIDSFTATATDCTKKNRKTVKYTWIATLLTCYTGYLSYACYRSIEDSIALLAVTGLVIFAYAYAFIRDHFGKQIWKFCLSPMLGAVVAIWKMSTWFILLVILAGIGVGLYFLCRRHPEQLISGVGLIFFTMATYLFSKNPRKVKWRPVIWGLVLQFLLALFILQTKAGYTMVHWLGDVVQNFLDYSDEGAKFVFGDPQYLDHFFAFKVLPLVVYFSTFISVLYYLGVMQYCVKKMAWLMTWTMQTSAVESLNIVGNIFVGPTEAPLLVRPFIKDMTKSELHAVITGGFATVAGSVLGAFIAFGVNASHLLSASVMSAPAALAISKLFYPETEESKFLKMKEVDLPKKEQRNFIEAMAYGAATAVPLTLNIAANLIAFIAGLALLNGMLGYLGGLVGIPELSFEFICSYAFAPLAFLMGVQWEDCRIVAELIGIKTFLNEFIAFERLGEIIENRVSEGEGRTISIRSEVIATYAVCGFSNVGTIGLQLGALTKIAPSRASDLADVAIRAFVAGSIACFMTACIAGLLYDVSDYDTLLSVNETSTAVPAVTFASDLTSRA